MAGRIDVVVVSYNSRETLRACVEPLVGLPGVAVFVVDNASADGSLEAVADVAVHAIASGRNGGFGFGCNVGLAAASAPLVLFLNPDARIDGDDLFRLAAALDAEPQTAIAGPRLLEAEGRLVPSMRRFQRSGSTWAQALFLHRLVRRASWANEIVRQESVYERPTSAEWLSGACLLARRDVIDAVGGFDEGFFLYCEDMDLCARVRQAGYEVRYIPSATARHDGGHSAPRSGLFPVLARSRLRYARKHSTPRSARLQHVGLAAGALTHLVASGGRPAHRRGHAAALAAMRPVQRHAGGLDSPLAPAPRAK